MKDALDTRYKHRYAGEHPSIPWLFEHAADTIHSARVGADGNTAYRRWTGQNINKQHLQNSDNTFVF